MSEQKPRRGMGPGAEGAPLERDPGLEQRKAPDEEVLTEREAAVPGMGGSSEPPPVYGRSGTRNPLRPRAGEERLPEVGRAPIPHAEVPEREGEE